MEYKSYSHIQFQCIYKFVPIYYNHNNNYYVFFLSSLAYPSTGCVVARRSLSALKKIISGYYCYIYNRKFYFLKEFLSLKNQESNPLNKLYKMYLS